MNNKYYTPKEDEFHSGFEYECCKCLSKSEDKIILDNIFVKYKFEVWDFLNYGDYYIDRCISDGMLRVKYLDKEDIESIGFKKSNKNSFLGYEDYFLSMSNDNNKYIRVATIHIPTNGDVYRIMTHRKYNDTETIDFENYTKDPLIGFAGNIKNKSELKKILMQLNIIGS